MIASHHCEVGCVPSQDGLVGLRPVEDAVSPPRDPVVLVPVVSLRQFVCRAEGEWPLLVDAKKLAKGLFQVKLVPFLEVSCRVFVEEQSLQLDISIL